MNKFKLLFVFIAFFGFAMNMNAQSKANDIPVKKLPSEVKAVLEQYVSILRNSSTLDECADKVIQVAGAGLVNEDGQSLRGTVKPYSLKKDWQNIKYYANPIKITRVNKNPNPLTSGYGASAFKGIHYKIWIAKKSGGAGMPAPISILVPLDKSNPLVQGPKIFGIGSL